LPAERAAADDAEPRKEGAARPEAGEPLPADALARLGSPWFRVGGHVTSLAFAADGKSILAANHALTVTRRDVLTGKALAEFKGHTSNVSAVALSPGGTFARRPDARLGRPGPHGTPLACGHGKGTVRDRGASGHRPVAGLVARRQDACFLRGLRG
jgi:hypothetical protein